MTPIKVLNDANIKILTNISGDFGASGHNYYRVHPVVIHCDVIIQGLIRHRYVETEYIRKKEECLMKLVQNIKQIDMKGLHFNFDQNSQFQSTLVSKVEREILNGHRGAVLWFTGLSGSGKSTLSSALDKRLYDQRIRTYLLDGDIIRRGLNRDLGFSKADRTENIRRIAEVAKLFLESGMIVIVASISPYQRDRNLAREIIGAENFLEIYVQCSLEECERRDPKGLYVKARRGEISHFTGITDPYESPENPEIIVRTEEESAIEATERIVKELMERKLI
jgi:adenylylsulfate kinase